LLPRLLRTAPSVECRVELMDVVAPEFGVNGPADAHPTFFLEFLQAIGADTSSARLREADEDQGARAEAEFFDGLSWCELLARILVGESLGPKVFDIVADGLRASYGLSARSVLYFTHHAKHDKRDAEILFRMLAREARTPEDRRRAVAMVDASYDW